MLNALAKDFCLEVFVQMHIWRTPVANPWVADRVPLPPTLFLNTPLNSVVFKSMVADLDPGVLVGSGFLKEVGSGSGSGLNIKIQDPSIIKQELE